MAMGTLREDTKVSVPEPTHAWVVAGFAFPVPAPISSGSGFPLPIPPQMEKGFHVGPQFHHFYRKKLIIYIFDN